MRYDADFGYGGNGNGQVGSNTLAHAAAPASMGEYNPPWSTLLFRKLLTNDGFRHAFIQRMAAHAATTFDPQRTLGLIDSLQANIAPEMPRHKGRWQQSVSFAPTWDALVDVMRTFATARPASVRGHVAGFFPEVLGSARLTITTSPGGRVLAAGVTVAPLRLDGTPQPVAGVFAPIFYRGVPLDLVAVPDSGYAFAGWSGLSESSAEAISVVLTESTALTATFAIATAAEAEAPGASALRAVHPNPTARTATVEATLGTPGALSVRVADILGREVLVLASGPAAAGTHRLVVDAGALPGGVYTVLMRSDGFRAARRLVVAR